MFTWPAAPVLAQFIWHNRKHIKGKQVIEVCANDNDFLFTATIIVKDSSHSHALLCKKCNVVVTCVSFKRRGREWGKELSPS